MKLLVTSLLVVFGVATTLAQVKIGNNPQNINAFSLLELESTDKALVISRVNNSQMQGMTPLRGALVFNTDEACVFHYTGTEWESLCQNTTNTSFELLENDLVLTDSDGTELRVSLSGAINPNFTTVPTEPRQAQTIVITQDGDNYNFEIFQVPGSLIANNSILGSKIADETIEGRSLNSEAVTNRVLALNAVTTDKIEDGTILAADLADGSVTDNKLDKANIPISGFGAASAAVDLGGQSITNLAEPTNLQDAATKNYVDNLATGLSTLADGTIFVGDAANTAQSVSISGDANLDNLGELTITDNAITTTKILDGNVTPEKLSAGTAGQILVSDGSVANWQDPAVIAVTTDGTTIVGDGDATAISVANDGITTEKILDGEVQTADIANGNVTPEKLSAGTDGQVLIANGGLVNWQDNTAANVAVDAAAITNLDAINVQDALAELQGDVDGLTLAGGADGNDFVTNGTLTGETVTLTVPNQTDVDIDLSPFALETEVTTAIAGVNQVPDDTGANNGDVLTTDGAGRYTWQTVAGGTTEEADGVTIVGDGTAGNLFTVGVIGSANIANATILLEDLNDMGATDNDVIKWSDTANAGAGGWITAPDNDSGAGTIGLTNGTVFIGDAANAASEQTIGGDATLATDGTLTINNDAIGPAKIAANAVTTDKIANDNITLDKLAPGTTAGQLLQWNGTNWELITEADINATVTEVDGIIGNEVVGATDGTLTLSGSGTVGNEYTLGVSADGITATEIATGAVNSDEIANATILAEDLNKMGATDGQVLKWEDATLSWITADDQDNQNADEVPVDGATNVNYAPIGGTNVLSHLNGIDAALATATVSGTEGSIFFADTDGTPTENNAQLFWDVTGSSGSGALGIGTNTPGLTNKLTVSGSVRASGIQNSNGTAGVPSYRFTNNGDTGMFLADPSGILGFSTNDIEALRINDTQSVIVNQDLQLDGTLTDNDGNVGTDGQILSKNGDGDVVWSDNAAIPSGLNQYSIPFVNATGDGWEEAVNTNGGQGFYWNPNARTLGGISYGALFVGLDLNTDKESNSSKVHIADNGPGFAYALQLQNYSGDDGGGKATGILFAVEAANSYGKGGLVYERKWDEAGPGFARGDFHFMQSDSADDSLPVQGDEVMTIKNNGDVGIGTTTPAAKLHVIGNIRADGEIEATGDITANVPDYVFQKHFLGSSALKADYEFKTLAQIERFVKENHHLPGVTSAKEAQASGVWNLSQSNLQNLEKIEELFLHTIAQEKKIQSLEAEKQALHQEVESLKKDMAQIKAILLQQKNN
ncbi:hypothetical protein [Flavobacterium sp. ASW18X]|uniref:beta strand repeat-containing protein n=1 Tax=Flavobacterium sp. ASW18X TaxID=2572595 RepID=UPI0010AE037C|nr:hypothetical protein [Flavobacterium sp. ASW18X]TKD59242.1 hypothetical protein FBT53_13550 [Flavobacterium sp. ASW18X]